MAVRPSEVKKLMLPDVPSHDDDEDVRHYYRIATGHMSMVAKFANMSIAEVSRMCVIDYWILRKDAFVQLLSQTKEGLEDLEAAWAKEQTKADRAALRALLG